MGTHSDPLSLQHHHPGPEGVDMEAAWGPKTAPNFTHSATVPTQALNPHGKPRLRGTEWQRNGTRAEKCELAGSPLHSNGVSSAWDPSPTQVQQVSRSKTTTKSKKQTHIHKKTHTQGQPQVKGHQKHQHFTAAQNLTRHGQHHGTGKTEAGRAKE